MKLRVKAIFVVAAIVAAQLLSAPARAADDFPMFLPADAKVPYQLTQCVLEKQLDCIESVEAVKDGVATLSTFVEYRNDEDFVDYDGNKRRNDRTVWSLPAEIAADPVIVDAELFPLKHSWPEPGGKRHYASSLMIRISGNESDLTTKFRIKVRTSWLVPQSVGMYMLDSEFNQEKITGGNRWTLGGVRSATYNYNGGWDKKMAKGANADVADNNLTFIIYHASKNPNEGFFGNECYKSGYMVYSANAPSGGNPYFNAESRSLDFNIQAPHRTTTGELNKGFFYLWVNKDYIRCMWPKSGLDKAKNFTVSVYNEDGSKQVATTTVVYKKGQLRVAAVNFHYSSPTIRLKAKK